MLHEPLDRAALAGGVAALEQDARCAAPDSLTHDCSFSSSICSSRLVISYSRAGHPLVVRVALAPGVDRRAVRTEQHRIVDLVPGAVDRQAAKAELVVHRSCRSAMMSDRSITASRSKSRTLRSLLMAPDHCLPGVGAARWGAACRRTSVGRPPMAFGDPGVSGLNRRGSPLSCGCGHHSGSVAAAPLLPVRGLPRRPPGAQAELGHQLPEGRHAALRTRADGADRHVDRHRVDLPRAARQLRADLAAQGRRHARRAGGRRGSPSAGPS